MQIDSWFLGLPGPFGYVIPVSYKIMSARFVFFWLFYGESRQLISVNGNITHYLLEYNKYGYVEEPT